MKPNREEALVDALGDVLRERFEKIEEAIRGKDRASILVLTVESMRSRESLTSLRIFVRGIAHERSRLVEAQGPTPDWLAKLDERPAP